MATTTKTRAKTTAAPPQPAENVMFGAPIYARRTQKTDRTKTVLMGAAGVLAVGAVAAVVLLTSAPREDEVAVLDTPAAPLLAPVPAIPLPRDTVIIPTQGIVSPALPAASRTRVARAPALRPAEPQFPAARSVDQAAADVSATVREPTPGASLPEAAPAAPVDVPEILSAPPEAVSPTPVG